jgi:REP-associated tyrosine transposase
MPVESDAHFLRVCRYVERNPLRAGLVENAEDWRWSSLWRRCNFCEEDVPRWPVVRPRNWVEYVNEPQNASELDAIQWAVRRDAPFGTPNWRDQTARFLKLNPQFPPRGRPSRSKATES